MIRRSAALLTVCSLLLLLLQSPSSGQVRAIPFTFVHVTDVHMGAPGSQTEAAKVFTAIKGAAPSFVVDGGDSTEMGRLQEYENYVRFADTLGVPVYAAPGNHDARWFDAGKQEFVQRFGAPFRSFDHGLVHFVLLDTSIDAETHGHFEESMLRWLRDDLNRVGTEVPVLIFFHHPIGFRPLSFVDNEQAFYNAIAPYNVRGIFTGHGHLDYQWQVNNVPHFMTQAGLEGGWRKVDVRETTFETREGAFSLARPTRPASVRVENAQFEGTQLHVTVRSENLPDGAVVYMRSGGAWQAMTRGNSGLWTSSLWVDNFPSGTHDLHIYATAEPNLPGQAATPDQWLRRDLGAAWTAEHRFELSTLGGATLAWRYQAEGSIQGPPAVADGRVFLASRDGSLTALNAATGARLWSTRLGNAPISAGVTAAAGSVFTGNTAGSIFAFDPDSGGARWQQKVGGPILAEPEYGEGLVYVGAADGYLYGLNAYSGEIEWRTPAGATVRAKPTYAHGTLYAGTWGGEVLALQAKTGRVLWRTRLTSNAYLAPANVPLTYYRGRVFATNSTGGSLTTGLWSLDARTGQILWQSDETAGYSSPFLRQHELVANTPAGRLFAVNPMTGARTWALNLGSTIFDSYATPFGGSIVNGSLYGRITGSVPSGIQWRYDVGDVYVFARLAADGDRVYAGTMDGVLYALQAVPSQLPPLPSFPDTAAHWAAEPVGGARQHGMVSGYEDGTFRPDALVTRAEMASMLARYLGTAVATGGNPFPDMENHWAAGVVAALAEQGLVSGQPGPDGLTFYRPDSPVSRAEAATMLARVLARTTPSPMWQSRFNDLAGHWARFTVEALEEIAMVGGYHVGSGVQFQPDSTLTRAEAATLLMRAAVPPKQP